MDHSFFASLLAAPHLEKFSFPPSLPFLIFILSLLLHVLHWKCLIQCKMGNCCNIQRPFSVEQLVAVGGTPIQKVTAHNAGLLILLFLVSFSGKHDLVIDLGTSLCCLFWKVSQICTQWTPWARKAKVASASPSSSKFLCSLAVRQKDFGDAAIKKCSEHRRILTMNLAQKGYVLHCKKKKSKTIFTLPFRIQRCLFSIFKHSQVNKKHVFGQTYIWPNPLRPQNKNLKNLT